MTTTQRFIRFPKGSSSLEKRQLVRAAFAEAGIPVHKITFLGIFWADFARFPSSKAETLTHNPHKQSNGSTLDNIFHFACRSLYDARSLHEGNTRHRLPCIWRGARGVALLPIQSVFRIGGVRQNHSEISCYSLRSRRFSQTGTQISRRKKDLREVCRKKIKN